MTRPVRSGTLTRFAVVVSVATSFVAMVGGPVTAGGPWSPTGSMGTAREMHTATLLGNGKVLVAGGNVGSASDPASSELYDPATGTWSRTAPMTTPTRVGPRATLLANGKVLVAGGTSATQPEIASA
ncbi:MAG: hypothetical protein QOK15_107, partial [Nocardioidaceae bacterium]|nr:hypothetical protein [Nocardioidaceae bacterium]